MSPFLACTWSLATFLLLSWQDLEQRVVPAVLPSQQDAVVDYPIFYRDQQGINPYCQQVWMGLQVKGIAYKTILVDTSPEQQTRSVPYIQWSADDDDKDDNGPTAATTNSIDDSKQAALKLLQEIQEKTPDVPPDLYKRVSKAVDNVGCNIVRLDGVFPRNTKPSLRVPFLVPQQQSNNDNNPVVSAATLKVTLEETDEVLEEYDEGPFLCGDFVSAADLVWMPFLERAVAQIPCVADIRIQENDYPTIFEWFQALQTKVPAYLCRVGSDAHTARALLQQAVQEGELAANAVHMPPLDAESTIYLSKNQQQDIWDAYRSDKPYLAATPQEECVAYFVQHKDALLEALPYQLSLDPQVCDQAARQVMTALLEGDGEDSIHELSREAQQVAKVLNDNLWCPRDMGILPASHLRGLVAKISKAAATTNMAV